jgi:hypothetical protein
MRERVTVFSLYFTKDDVLEFALVPAWLIQREDLADERKEIPGESYNF